MRFLPHNVVSIRTFRGWVSFCIGNFFVALLTADRFISQLRCSWVERKRDTSTSNISAISCMVVSRSCLLPYRCSCGCRLYISYISLCHTLHPPFVRFLHQLRSYPSPGKRRLILTNMKLESIHNWHTQNSRRQKWIGQERHVVSCLNFCLIRRSDSIMEYFS